MSLSLASPDKEGEKQGKGQELQELQDEVRCNEFISVTKESSINREGEADEESDDEESVDQEVSGAEEIRTIHTPCFDGCTVCGALPFQRSTGYVSEAVLWDDAAAWDWDGGLYDLVRKMNGHDSGARLTTDVAKATVDATTKYLTQLKEQLMKAGLQKHYDQEYSGESLTSARVLAPFDFSELELGKLLGTGGFNCVTEVNAFKLIAREGRILHPFQEQSRQFLENQALIHPSAELGTTGSYEKSVRQKRSQPFARYAVKHLRSKLVTRTPEKFKRAAIDLVLECQLLKILDHPHIISLRGWSAGGPEAFSSGDPQEFFLLLDRLPESLEDRMWVWRTKLIQYQRKYKRLDATQRGGRRVTSWVRRTLGGTPNDEQPTPPNKFAIKICGLLLERLQIAAGIAQAIHYMHAKRLIHRDVKTANIGFDILGDVKLFDLGLSRLLPTKKAETTSLPPDENPLGGEANRDDIPAGCMADHYVMSRVGTKFYMAPEIRRKDPYGAPADVYSFGVILWEMLSLSTPRDLYHHERDLYNQATKGKASIDSAAPSKYATIKQQVKDGSCSWLPVCACWPVGLQGLVASTLTSNPAERPTMEEVLLVLQQHIDALYRDLGSGKAPVVRRSLSFRIDLSQLDQQSDRFVVGGGTDPMFTPWGGVDAAASAVSGSPQSGQ